MEKKTLFRGRFKMEKSDARAMRFYSIRMRILWFINAFWRYMMTTVSVLGVSGQETVLMTHTHCIDPSRRDHQLSRQAVHIQRR